MHAYEFPARITPTGSLELPEAALESLPVDQQVRVIVLVPEPAPYDTDLTPEEEDEAWARLGEAAMLNQYDEADAIYEQLGAPDAAVPKQS